jgi:SAM-dependent methyltransferase
MKGVTDWNQRYSTLESAYGFRPNKFLKEQLSLLKPSSILLPGEGEGRNALWAAKQGWDVSAFDYSEVAHNKALNLFRENGVIVNYTVCDALDYHYKIGFDVVALIFVHLPGDIRPIFYQKIISAIKPKGKLIIECFHPEQILRSSGGPKNPELLPSMDELKKAFDSLQFRLLQKVEVELSEGSLHQGKAIVIRLIAEKV